MEQWFKITLWMFVLIGSLQALPYFRIKPYSGVQTKVTCETNVTFNAPTNVQNSCHTAALGYFIEGLKQANQTCTDPEKETLSLLDLITNPENTNGLNPVAEPTTSPQAECMLLESGKKYAEFRKSLFSFLRKLNTQGARG